MNRLHNLDYLRGIAAFGVMVYHLLSWNFGVFDSNSFWGRFGLYGVAVFYVLSGLTMYSAYYKRMDLNFPSIKDFFVKRFLRIMPLLWLAIVLTYFSKGIYIPRMDERFIINVTGLLFIDCNQSIARGGWSIGNEIAFYLFFPFFIVFSKHYKPLFYGLGFIILSLFLWFAFFHIDSSSPIEKEWYKYINPLNQVFLFLAGYLVGYYFKGKEFNQKAILGLLVLSFVLFTFLPVYGDRVLLITDYNRLIFSFISIVVCFCVFKWKGELSKWLHVPLSRLGENSYSVYLLHPIVFAVVSKFLPFGVINFSLGVLITLVVSHFVYNYFEKPFIKLGRNAPTRQAANV